VLLVVLSAALSLLLAELLARAAGMRPLGNWSSTEPLLCFDPVLGWRNLPNRHGELVTPHFRIEVSTNAFGMRDQHCSVDRSPGTRRILLLGDSLAWGFGVGPEDRLDDRLELLLPATEVLNAAVPGYSTDQELLWYEQQGCAFRADLVILQLCGNDLPANVADREYFMYEKPRLRRAADGTRVDPVLPLMAPSSGRRMHRWLLTHLALAGAVDRAVERMTRSPASELSLRMVRGREAPLLTRWLLARLRERVESDQARLVVVTSSTWWDHYCGPYETFLQSLRDEGFEVFATESSHGFDSAAHGIPGDGHWNAAGHACIARALAAYIERCCLLPARAADPSNH